LHELPNDIIVNAVQALHPHAVDLLKRLVACPSTVGRESAAQLVILEELDRLGFDTEQIAIPDNISADPTAGIPQQSYDGRFNVVGRTPPTGRSRLLINGHIDVVPAEPHTWTTDPYTPVVDGGHLYGRGAGDMKGGFAMAFLALAALRSISSELVSHDLAVVSVIEEECTGNGTLATLKSGVDADAVLLPEPTQLGLLLGGIGVTWVDIRLGFAGGHAESSDRLEHPMDVLVDVVRELANLERSYNVAPPSAFAGISQPYNVNVGIVTGGNWPSSVPSSLVLRVRVGHPGSAGHQDVLAEIDACVNRVLASRQLLKTTATVHPSGFRAQEYLLDAHHPLVQALSEAHAAIHGTRPEAYVLGSTTDARYYVNQAQVPALCYGPRAFDIHGSNEHVDLASIAHGAATLAKFISLYHQRNGLVGYEGGA
jgi:acetylornithine deacetylase